MKKLLMQVALCVFIASSSTAMSEEVWHLADDKTNHLLAGDVSERIGLKEDVRGRKRFWVGGWSTSDQVFEWPVKAGKPGKCHVILLVQSNADSSFILSSSKDKTVLQATGKGGWHRIYGEINIDQEDALRLSLQQDIRGPKSKIERGLRIVGLEVITESYQPVYEKRIKELRTSAEDAAWFQNAGFGIMFQWGNWGYPREGEKKTPWNKIYEDFDIEAFADQMKALNPGYLIWSVTWRGSRFSAPLKSVDEIMGNSDYTMEYDFLGELVDALTERDIPVLFYYHPGAEEPGFWEKVWHGYDDVDVWEDANVAIWTEIGERLGDKLSGWFVDDGMAQYYPADFYRYAVALKAGNPKRLITFNPWLMPNTSPFDDVSMGEGHAPGELKEGIFVNGPTKGLLAHTMRTLDCGYWGIWTKGQKLEDISNKLEELQEEIDSAKKNKHPVSFCIGMYEDGSLHEKTIETFKKLQR